MQCFYFLGDDMHLLHIIYKIKNLGQITNDFKENPENKWELNEVNIVES